MNNQYTFFEDAGHGWLSVKKTELKQLNIADKITSFSYMNGNSAYLEEDCDLTTFLNARFSIDLYDKTVREHLIKSFFEHNVKTSYNHNSPVRRFYHYSN